MAAKIMASGYNVFSPITHSHHIAVIGKLPALDHEFWLKMDKWYVERCDEVWVYIQDGWVNSAGVNRELSWARMWNKPIRYVYDNSKIEYKEEARPF